MTLVASKPAGHVAGRVAGRLLAVLLVAVAGLIAAGVVTPAAAHPFGPPPVAKVTADRADVTVTWSAARDDLLALGLKAGAFPAGTVTGPDDLSLGTRLQGSAPVAAYLSRHIRVAQDNRACRATAVDTARMLADGAQLRFACGSQVSALVLTVTALTDVDRAYRTVSVTANGSGALHTAAEPAKALDLTGAGRPAAPAPAPGWTADLTALLDGGAALPIAVLLSALVGAAHACAPGHGKTLAAGCLVGGHGKARHAAWLGAVVAVMHTLSVVVLAVGWWALAEAAPDLAAVTGWLQLAGSLLVLGVGLALLLRHLRSSRRHDHGHGTSHGHGHGHHVVEPAALLTRRGLLLIGTSGGLLPSPSAFLVLLGGLLTGRVVTAVVMVLAFGAGMALTLTGAGLAVVFGRDAVLRRASASSRLRRWSLYLPPAAAALVVLGGTVATVLSAVRVAGS